MNSFSEAQKEWRKAANPMNVLEAQAKRNMVMFEQAMKVFMPTVFQANRTERASPAPNPFLEYQTEAMAAMHAQMEAIQKQLSELSRKD